MRIAIGGISHETNTYCKDLTRLEDFDIDRGPEMVEKAQGTRTYIAGMLDAAAELGAEAVPTLYSFAQPSGVIAKDAYFAMRDELVSRVRDAMPLDAVALAPHGAGVVEGIDDLETDLARAVREVAGRIPIVAALDLHGNISDDMAESYDAMFGVQFYPHTDMNERGHEAVTILPDIVSGRLRPVTHVEHVPMLLPPTTTTSGVGSRMNKVCWECESRDRVMDCTVFHGFPFCDVPDVGVHVVCTTDGDGELAKSCATEVARWIWEHREEYRLDVLDPKEAVALAMSVDGGPVVINDTADNCGGGAPGDATHLLRAMIDAGLHDACFSFIVDPEVAAVAHKAGAGATIEVALGGKTDDLHGEPTPLTAYVKSLSDGKVVMQALMRGAELDHGKMARLVVGGIDVLVGSKRTQTFDPEPFLLHGIDVTRYKIVAVKSSNHFRAGFEPLATRIVTADSPGLTTVRTEVFPRSRNPVPLWPRDPEAAYP